MRVHIAAASDTMYFTGTAFGMDGNTFLDLVPELPDDVVKKLDRAVIYFLPVHTVAKIRLTDTKMDFSFMDPFKLHDFLAQHPNVLPHAKPEKGLIAITATRLENYEFLKTHAHQIEDLFEENIARVRRAQ